LTPGALRKAEEAAAWIKSQDVEKIRLVGFTDTIGTKANNRSLAKRRATSLLRVFEAQGVDLERIEIIANGEVGAREVTADHTAEPLNRCVGVFIGAGG
jgi:outer membrane protein OmpA-like peptidoglycan-associated protein